MRQTSRILNAEPNGYSEEAAEILRSIAHLDLRSLSRVDLLNVVGKYDALIIRLGFQIDQDVFDMAKKLSVVVTPTTGLDHIDLECAAKRGVTVLSLQGETEFLQTVWATAEHTWALLLALVRYIPWALDSVRAGEWERDRFRGSELRDKRLGLVGCGRLGEKVAGYGLAFGMDVATYDPYRDALPENVKRCGTLPELLRRSDLLSIHVPLNEETARLIGRAELEQLPVGAVLVNTSRGPVIDEDSLIVSLQSGRLAGAALDVVEQETQLRSGEEIPLIAYARSHNNLLITPHLGGATVESMCNTEVFMAKKLAAFLGGRTA